MRSIDVEAKRSYEFYGMTCLHAAAANGHLDVCRLLIDKGAQLEAIACDGVNPLQYAAFHGRIEIVRLLCDRGADIEAQTKSGWRTLHIAAFSGNISVVKELIEVRNAEINARSNSGLTALSWARDEGRDDTAAYLVSHGGVDG
jgi:ankyrin repeat protein